MKELRKKIGQRIGEILFATDRPGYEMMCIYGLMALACFCGAIAVPFGFLASVHPWQDFFGLIGGGMISLFFSIIYYIYGPSMKNERIRHPRSIYGGYRNLGQAKPDSQSDQRP